MRGWLRRVAPLAGARQKRGVWGDIECHPLFAAAHPLGRRICTRDGSNPAPQRLDLQRVLVVAKKTRLATEAGAFADTDSTENVGMEVGTGSRDKGKIRIERELSLRGLNYKKLKDSHDSHSRAVEDVLQTLEKRGVSIDFVTASRGSTRDFPESYDNYDVIIAAGGDGTFLKAASEIPTSSVPIIGVNTDPATSKGALCSVNALEEKGRGFESYLDRLEKGDFEWRLRSRVCVSLEEYGTGIEESQNPNTWRRLEQVALNEIFFAERDVAHPIQHELIINDDEGDADVQLSSGILICTGTGSSAWMRHAMSIDQENVAMVLEEAARAGAISTVVPQNVIADVTSRMNERVAFSPTSYLMRYHVRELVNNGLRPACKHRSGMAHSVTIRSKGWDPTMTIDGIHVFQLPAGHRAHFHIAPDAGLLTYHFPSPYPRVCKEV